jgi:hypothetical protein
MPCNALEATGYQSLGSHEASFNWLAAISKRSRTLAPAVWNARKLKRLAYNVAVHEPVPVQVFGRRHDEIDALMRPATEKGQGTKSRSEVHRWCGGLYGELTAAHELEAV